MNKFFYSILGLSLFLTGCSYDDGDVWERIDDLDSRLKNVETLVARINGELSAIKTIVEASSDSKAILDVTENGSGYVITFSDGSSVNINHGTNGDNGTNAPVIGIKKDSDGVYYWTITSDSNTIWLYDDDEKQIPVAGEKGADGTHGSHGNDGITPALGVDAHGFWTVDYGNGHERVKDAEGNDVKATGDAGESLFENVDTSDDNFVVFHMSNGEIVVIAKTDARFGFIDKDKVTVVAGSSIEIDIELKNILYAELSGAPQGWTATIDIDNSVVIISAPSSEGDAAGLIYFTALDKNMNILQAGLLVETQFPELRILTFEDEDYMGPNASGYWSALIDYPQYGGPLLYGDFMNVDYHWYDEGNTFLASEFPESSFGKVYWGGGHAISNYTEQDLSKGSFQTQLAVYYMNPETGYSGNNGSQNFCVHFGYDDGMGWTDASLPFIYFGDGVARVVDHMYITLTTYLVNCVINGNNLTAPVGPDGFVRIVAIGFDEHGEEITDIRPKCDLANEHGVVADWKKWDLSALGKVTKIEFNIEGDSDNGYGFSQPAYFAYDDIAVWF